jgi:hypothetical protein
MTMTETTPTTPDERPSGLRLVAALGALVLAVGASASLTASAAEAKPRASHCVTPSGVDLNELFDVEEPIVTDTCTRIGTGWHWRPTLLPWFVNDTFEVVPEGFVPAGSTPVEDFLAKFVAVRYVVDPDTRRERGYRFTNNGRIGTAISEGLPVVSPLTLGALKPLPPGEHAVDIYWEFRAMHCDGFGDVTEPGANCFPAGETQLPSLTFTVTPGHHRGR